MKKQWMAFALLCLAPILAGVSCQTKDTYSGGNNLLGVVKLGPFPAQRVTGRLAMPGTYRATLARAGFAEREIAEVSERLVDAVVAHGSGAAIAAKVAEHLAAGADHVLLMPAANDAAAGVGELERLAPALGLDG